MRASSLCSRGSLRETDRHLLKSQEGAAWIGGQDLAHVLDGDDRITAWNLDWRLDYLASAVNLVVWSSGDFNHDGLVGTADYVIWRNNGGTQAEYDTWRSRFGLAGGIGTGLGSASTAVPEPSIAALFVISAIATLFTRRRCSACMAGSI